MFMRRPTSPVTRFRGSKAGQDAPCLDILSERNVNRPRIRRSPGFELQRAVFFDVCVSHYLKRISLFDFRGAFGQVNRTLGSYFDLGVAWQIDRIILADLVCLAVGLDRAFTRQANETRLEFSG